MINNIHTIYSTFSDMRMHICVTTFHGFTDVFVELWQLKSIFVNPTPTVHTNRIKIYM